MNAHKRTMRNMSWLSVSEFGLEVLCNSEDFCYLCTNFCVFMERLLLFVMALFYFIYPFFPLSLFLFSGRQEIVELPVLSQEGSEVSCLSEDFPGSQKVGINLI